MNFLKYKKPEKDLSNLDRSETFKIIHHIEQEPRHGIPVRAPIVLCEEDVRNVSEDHFIDLGNLINRNTLSSFVYTESCLRFMCVDLRHGYYYTGQKLCMMLLTFECY